MNNEPLELARTDLAGLAGCNPRAGTQAMLASILIDPFPDLATAVDDASRGQATNILNVDVSLMQAWKDQTRFDPIDLGMDQVEPLPPWPAGKYLPDFLRTPLTQRLDAVLDRLLRTSVNLNWFFRWAAKLGLAKVRSTLVDKSIETVTAQLKARSLI